MLISLTLVKRDNPLWVVHETPSTGLKPQISETLARCSTNYLGKHCFVNFKTFIKNILWKKTFLLFVAESFGKFIFRYLKCYFSQGENNQFELNKIETIILTNNTLFTKLPARATKLITL